MERLTGSLEVDISHMKETLGWQPPFSTEQGIRVVTRWYHTQGQYQSDKAGCGGSCSDR